MRKYRWPLVLFVGIPFVAQIGYRLAIYAYDLSTYGNPDTHELSLFANGAGSLTAAVVLAVLYPRLRNTESSLLRLVWSFTLVLTGISALLYLSAAFAGYGDSLSQLFDVFTLGALLSLPPLLWFARQASRASLMHAYFLVFIVGGVTLPDVAESLPFYFEWLWRLAGSLLAAWLLANFDVRGLYFRGFAVAVVVVLGGLLYLPLLTFPLFLLHSIVLLLLFPLKLALIYLVRVRQPLA